MVLSLGSTCRSSLNRSELREHKAMSAELLANRRKKKNFSAIKFVLTIHSCKSVNYFQNLKNSGVA